jgi:hypothetical protein
VPSSLEQELLTDEPVTYANGRAHLLSGILEDQLWDNRQIGTGVGVLECLNVATGAMIPDNPAALSVAITSPIRVRQSG